MKARLKRHFVAKDPILGEIVSLTEQYGLTNSPYASAFETLAHSIASQQISGAVARKMIERLKIQHGGRFPTPGELATATAEALRPAGFSFAKIAALKDLAAHCLDGRLPEDPVLAAMSDEEIIQRCVAVRGIGTWTAQMLLMFHFGREDVLPVDDFGVRNGFRLAYRLKGMPKPKALLAYGERWAPYRSAAAWYLWRAVELHKDGRLPKRSGRAPRIELEKARVPKASKAPKASKTKRGAKSRKVRSARKPKAARAQ